MRHRKVLNLYDTDINHEDLLVYLESIEGNTRQSQALVQMALIGFRVTVLHESGDQAYYSVRNPDAAAALTRKKHATKEAKRPLSIEKPDRLKGHAENQVEADKEDSTHESSGSDQIFSSEPSQESPDNNHHHDDEYNTLRILRDLSEES